MSETFVEHISILAQAWNRAESIKDCLKWLKILAPSRYSLTMATDRGITCPPRQLHLLLLLSRDSIFLRYTAALDKLLLSRRSFKVFFVDHESLVVHVTVPPNKDNGLECESQCRCSPSPDQVRVDKSREEDFTQCGSQSSHEQEQGRNGGSHVRGGAGVGDLVARNEDKAFGDSAQTDVDKLVPDRDRRDTIASTGVVSTGAGAVHVVLQDSTSDTGKSGENKPNCHAGNGPDMPALFAEERINDLG